MEKGTISLFFENKTITNPINKNEIFNCSDLYKDFTKCVNLNRYGRKRGTICNEIKNLARSCYLYPKEDFEKQLVLNFDEKKKYIDYLKKEDSILYHVYLNNPNTYSISNFNNIDSNLAEDINKNIS